MSLELMLDTAFRLRALSRERTREHLDTDEVALLAMLHLIQRLGEAASRLSADFRAAHPEFPWGGMIGMRNRIVHAYDDLDPDIVWHIATEDIEAVIAALERVLAD
ncbi:MAG: DUF86 domain-containing protein [Gemmatimonadetes bacterium]|nr:DUF86 domain-containing protein [Gemmatimonadota bacterium]